MVFQTKTLHKRNALISPRMQLTFSTLDLFQRKSAPRFIVYPKIKCAFSLQHG